MSTEQLAKWLRIAIKQNEHDMLLTDEEIREARAALAAHEAEKAQAAAPVGWMIEGSDRVWWGEFAEMDTRLEARRVGGTCVAFPVYRGSAPAAPVAAPLTCGDVVAALRKIAMAARASVSTPGHDACLMQACDEAEAIIARHNHNGRSPDHQHPTNLDPKAREEIAKAFHRAIGKEGGQG